MTITMTCKRCDAEITATDEDELVTAVQSHIRDHGGEHAPSREQILARLHRETSKEG